MGARNFKARRKPFTLFFVLIGLTMAMSATLCSCGALLDSDREVERHLQELYGIPFEVIDAQRISDEHLQEGVWAAKVYEVIPQDDPDSPFWAYSIISGETGGVPGFQEGFRNTYALKQMEEILGDALETVGISVEFKYETSPCKDMDEKYFSGLRILIDVGPDNLHLVCETVSTALQEVLDKTALTNKNKTSATIFFSYREESWEEDEFALAILSPFYWMSWDDEEEEYFWGPLDFSAETLEKTILHEIELKYQ